MANLELSVPDARQQISGLREAEATVTGEAEAMAASNEAMHTGVPYVSPYLDRPCRSPERAALDKAQYALSQIVGMGGNAGEIAELALAEIDTLAGGGR